MKTWISSLAGASILSFAHLLLEMWRGFLDFSLVLPQFAGDSTSNLALYGLVYTAIFAGWRRNFSFSPSCTNSTQDRAQAAQAEGVGGPAEAGDLR